MRGETASNPKQASSRCRWHHYDLSPPSPQPLQVLSAASGSFCWSVYVDPKSNFRNKEHTANVPNVLLCKSEISPRWNELNILSHFIILQPAPFRPPCSFLWHLHSSQACNYPTSCDYDLSDKGLGLFTPSEIHNRFPFRLFAVSLIGSLLCWTCYVAGFLMVEATDLNKCVSIMNAAPKLWKSEKPAIHSRATITSADREGGAGVATSYLCEKSWIFFKHCN